MIVIHEDFHLEAIERGPSRWVTRITHLHGNNLKTGANFTSQFWDTMPADSVELTMKMAVTAIDTRFVTALR